MSVSLHRIEVVLKLPENVPRLVVKARAIIEAMTGNPWFPSPSPSLAKVSAATDALDAAHTTTLSRARGSSAVRNEKRAVLVGLLNRLRAYVEGIAQDNPESAGTIAESASMDLKKRTLPVKPPFVVKPGPVEGSAAATVKAAAKTAGYEWQWREDGSPKWNDAARTLQAKTVIRGLAPGKKCWFRYRVTSTKGQGDWSQEVSMIVQ